MNGQPTWAEGYAAQLLQEEPGVLQRDLYALQFQGSTGRDVLEAFERLSGGESGGKVIEVVQPASGYGASVQAVVAGLPGPNSAPSLAFVDGRAERAVQDTPPTVAHDAAAAAPTQGGGGLAAPLGPAVLAGAMLLGMVGLAAYALRGAW